FLSHAADVPSVRAVLPVQIELVGFYVVGLTVGESSILRGGQLELEAIGDGAGDLVLNCEHVLELAVVTLGPDVITVADVDELRRDTHPVPGATHASFENCFDVELLTDLGDADWFSLESERRCPGRHLQRRNAGERIEDFFRNTVREVLVVAVRAHVGEWHYGDRCLFDRARGRGGFRWRCRR